MYLLSNWRRQGISRVQLEWSTTDNCNSVSNTETSISSGILPHRQGKHLEKSKLGYFSKSNKGINRKKHEFLLWWLQHQEDTVEMCSLQCNLGCYTQLVHPLFIPFSFHVHHTIYMSVFFWEFSSSDQPNSQQMGNEGWCRKIIPVPKRQTRHTGIP